MLRDRPLLSVVLVAAPIAFFCVLLFVARNSLSTGERVVGAIVLVAVAPLLYVRVRNL